MEDRTGPDEKTPPAEPEQTEQPPGEPAAEPTAPPAYSRELLDAVRREAGFRVSPRQLTAALDALADADIEPTVERLVTVIQAAQGERSARQRRHADLWRALGAQLALRGAPADPSAQQAFIGRAKAVARREVSDQVLLRVALAVAAEDIPFEARTVGEVTRWILDHHGADVSDSVILEAVPDALKAVTDERSRPEREAGPRRGPAQGRPFGTGPWRRGSGRYDPDPIRRRRRAPRPGRTRRPR